MSRFFKKYGSILLILVMVLITFICFRAVEQKEPLARDEKKEKTALPITAKPKRKPLVICIDPGHQQKADLSTEKIGPGANQEKPKVTGGTRGITTGTPEYKLTLKASRILGAILKEKGFNVVYTRTSNDVNVSNKVRAEMANVNKADLFIRLHADGSTNRSVRGFSILTPSSKNPYTKTIYKDSLKASQLIVDEVKENRDVKVNGISFRDDLSGTNWSQVPAVLIEMGFMTNPIEDKNLSNETYLTYLMKDVARGIVDFRESVRRS
ncbi:N-acetylmuramoyl-L-alanine amidase [Bacillus salipaludis]|uniref:N-acetylmuramoyl-L-alanine amidase n=1 Tax=Bacillus salipaludis TaxID=2547811 RepID=A0A4R5VI84_9BACI|nr:N-acetylmuramoyl-L-alanine amidase [Bacillus salipaludis]TDK55936.1 N-acetylmuramoyl-L-alanine amidase [Bacillus salipaludis]